MLVFDPPLSVAEMQQQINHNSGLTAVWLVNPTGDRIGSLKKMGADQPSLAVHRGNDGNVILVQENDSDYVLGTMIALVRATGRKIVNAPGETKGAMRLSPEDCAAEPELRPGERKKEIMYDFTPPLPYREFKLTQGRADFPHAWLRASGGPGLCVAEVAVPTDGRAQSIRFMRDPVSQDVYLIVPACVAAFRELRDIAALFQRTLGTSDNAVQYVPTGEKEAMRVVDRTALLPVPGVRYSVDPPITLRELEGCLERHRRIVLGLVHAPSLPQWADHLGGLALQGGGSGVLVVCGADGTEAPLCFVHNDKVSAEPLLRALAEATQRTLASGEHTYLALPAGGVAKTGSGWSVARNDGPAKQETKIAELPEAPAPNDKDEINGSLTLEGAILETLRRVQALQADVAALRSPKPTEAAGSCDTEQPRFEPDASPKFARFKLDPPKGATEIAYAAKRAGLSVERFESGPRGRDPQYHVTVIREVDYVDIMDDGNGGPAWLKVPREFADGKLCAMPILEDLHAATKLRITPEDASLVTPPGQPGVEPGDIQRDIQRSVRPEPPWPESAPFKAEQLREAWDQVKAALQRAGGEWCNVYLPELTELTRAAVQSLALATRDVTQQQLERLGLVFDPGHPRGRLTVRGTEIVAEFGGQRWDWMINDTPLPRVLAPRNMQQAYRLVSQCRQFGVGPGEEEIVP